MTYEQLHLPTGNATPPDPQAAEAKRIAARRRFLTRGAAGGSGLLIVTLCHQRAFARRPGLLDNNNAPQTATNTTSTTRHTPYQPQGVLVSSMAHCTSLHGTGTHVTITDSITQSGTVSRVDCVRN